MLRERLTRYYGLLAAAGLAGLLALVLWPPMIAGCVIAGSAGLVALLTGFGVAFPHWQWFGPSVCRVATDRKVVALTFDDGPDPDATTVLADVLDRAGIRATFFCVGERAARQPELIRRLAAAGHLMGNHSWAHHHWTNLFRVARLRDDVSRAQAELTRLTGQRPGFFRPPMGLTSPRVFRVARELDLAVVGWTVRGLDRRERSPERVVGRLLRGLRPGAILLLHDGGIPGDRLRAVAELLIDNLNARGYQALRLDELRALAERP